MATNIREAQYTIDTLLQLKDPGAVTATGNAQVGGADKIIDLGGGHYGAEVMVDVSAMDATTGDEGYWIQIEGSDSSDFAAGTPLITVLAALPIGGGTFQPGAAATASAVGRYIIPFRNELNGHVFRYLRIEHVISGTTPSINYTAYIVHRKW